ncbi:MAG: flagellar biosynthesis anti-sigma factor FlgM, partial [Deltaproteobacteria bacterium]|nr:flagellar biosynthesis anti-sigma factor FlgM [Deltaproteobacteria bacterium]
MKVGGKKPGVSSNTYVKKAGGAAEQAKQIEAGRKASEGDNVDISTRAKALTNAKRTLDDMPDVRGELVVRLKTDIEGGGYNVDSGKVAEKMIERAVRDAV